ncbi:two-component regulator propeller domain-containing protein [Phocaeicola sp.]
MGMGKIILIITLLCLSCGVNANEFMFKHLEVKDGLSNNQVLDIYKDSEGFVWFATASGLDRYDGNRITIFRSSETDQTSLPNNYIKSLQEDNKGNLWILTGSGYAIYNPETETFNRDVRGWLWEVGIDGNPALVYIDHNKNMWFYVADKGCFLYIPESQLLYPLLFEAQQLPQGRITDIVECKDGVLLAYDNGTLICLDENTNKIKWQQQDIVKEVGAGKTGNFALFVDKDDDIWVYSPLGLWVYNPEQKKWQSHLCNLIKRQPHNAVRAVAQDKEGRIWIGKEQEGIDILDKQTGEVRQLRHKTDDERSLQNNAIMALYEDANEIMWVGTDRKGVSYYNESAFKFGIEHVGDITCMAEDKNSYVWLGTGDGKLIYWDATMGERAAFANSGDWEADAILSLLKARDGKLWIGTSGEGLVCYDNGRFTPYKNKQGQNNSLIHNDVCALAESRDGIIWIGTPDRGVQSLNPGTGLFTAYSASSEGLASDHISSLCIGKDNQLWIGTAEGLSVLDLGTKKITNMTGTKSGKEHFSNQNITQIYEDSRGLIWIGTREGLNVYNPKTDELSVLHKEQGLSSSIISGIVEDGNQHIWVTTANGVTNIIPAIDDKNGRYSFRCYVFDDKDGLQNCEFNVSSIKKLSSGEILMGGLYGINCFQPDEIKYNKLLPKVLFTQFYLFNEEVKVGKKYGDRIILDKALNRVGKIELGYEQNIFSVQFASDNYILPEKIKYAYKLEGFSDDWLTTTEGKVTYTNLSPGTYTLKVKAINGDGYSGDEEASLKIIVQPPFWLSMWAYAIYAALLVIALILMRHFMKRSVRNQLDRKPKSQSPSSSEVIEEKVLTKEEEEEAGHVDLIEVNGVLMLRSMVENGDKMDQGEESEVKIMKEEVKEEKAVEEVGKVDQIEKPEGISGQETTVAEETGADEVNLIEDIDTVLDIAPQRAMIIQLTEENDRIVTHVVPPEDLPEMTGMLGFRKNMLSTASSARDLIGGRKVDEYGMVDAEATAVTADERFIDQAMKYVEDNVSRSDFSVEELSRHLGMSRVNLYKKLSAITGKTPIEFIRVIRLKRAARLLLEKRQNISEVAFQVGFNNPKYFSKYFKEEFGVLPSVYQERGGVIEEEQS